MGYLDWKLLILSDGLSKLWKTDDLYFLDLFIGLNQIFVFLRIGFTKKCWKQKNLSVKNVRIVFFTVIYEFTN